MNTRTLDHPWAVRRTVRDLYRLVANEAIPLERAAILARIAELLLVSTRRRSPRRPGSIRAGAFGASRKQ